LIARFTSDRHLKVAHHAVMVALCSRIVKTFSLLFRDILYTFLITLTEKQLDHVACASW